MAFRNIEHEVVGGQVQVKDAASLKPLLRGDQVRFALPDGFIQGTVTFEGKSPFDTHTLAYPGSAVVRNDAEPGRYVYSCAVSDGKGHDVKSKGGGEVEVGTEA